MLDTFVDQLKSISICYYRSRSIALGSSTAVLMVFKQVTASLPSIRRWSYVRAMYIIGRITTCPFLTTGLSNVPCIPRIADWGGFMIGVPNKEPNTPPFEIVKIPPSMSSMLNSFFFA